MEEQDIREEPIVPQRATSLPESDRASKKLDRMLSGGVVLGKGSKFATGDFKRMLQSKLEAIALAKTRRPTGNLENQIDRTIMKKRSSTRPPTKTQRFLISD